jgi:hypothetical protein
MIMVVGLMNSLVLMIVGIDFLPVVVQMGVLVQVLMHMLMLVPVAVLLVAMDMLVLVFMGVRMLVGMLVPVFPFHNQVPPFRGTAIGSATNARGSF